MASGKWDGLIAADANRNGRGRPFFTYRRADVFFVRKIAGSFVSRLVLRFNSLPTSVKYRDGYCRCTDEE